MQPFSRNWNGELPADAGRVLSCLEAGVLTCPGCTTSYRSYGSGPTKYPLADMLQFVLEFATTKPPNGSAAEDPRPSSPAPSPAGQPAGEAACQDSR